MPELPNALRPILILRQLVRTVEVAATQARNAASRRGREPGQCRVLALRFILGRTRCRYAPAVLVDRSHEPAVEARSVGGALRLGDRPSRGVRNRAQRALLIEDRAVGAGRRTAQARTRRTFE